MMGSYNSYTKRYHAFWYVFVLCLLGFVPSFAMAGPDCGLNVGSIQVGDLHTLGIDFDPGDILNKFACEIFVVHTSEVATMMAGPAKSLLFILLSIDFVWTGINWILDETDLQSIAGTFVKKIIYIGFILGLIDYAVGAAQSGNLMDNRNWIATLPNSFVAIGDEVARSVDPGAGGGGNSMQTTIGNPYSISVNPGRIMNNGILIAFSFLGKVLKSFMDLSAILPWNILPNFLIFVIAILVCMMIIMMFGLMASDMLVNFIEAYITMAVGIFILGFAGSRWTMSTINVFLAYMIGLGLRMMIGMAVYALCVVILQDAINADAPIKNGVTAFFEGSTIRAWNTVVNTLGNCFIMFMIVNKVPDITAGFSSNSPMLTAGAGLKAAVSSMQSGMKGAALGSQVLGAGMQGLGQRMTGKVAWGKGTEALKPKVGAKAEGRVDPPKKEEAKKPSSGLGKDAKTTGKNLAFMKGSATRNAVKAFNDNKGQSFGARVKAAGGELARSAGAKEKSKDGKDVSTAANVGNVAQRTTGRALNTLGKVAGLAGRSMDGGEKGNKAGKLLGGTLSKISGSGHLGSDAPVINYLSTFNVDVPE